MPDSSPAPTELQVSAAPRSRLELSFAVGADGETQLTHQFAGYPFHLCRPFRLNGDPAGMLTLYLQSCSGGIYEGDRLSTFVQIAEGAAAHAGHRYARELDEPDPGDAPPFRREIAALSPR